jgi:hypothetical protein
MNAARLGDILKKSGLVDELQLRSAMARQSQWGGRLVKHVADLGFAREDAVVQALAGALGLQQVGLGAMPHDAGALSKIDVRTAEEKGIFPYALRDNGKTLWLAMADPTDLETVDFVVARTGCRVRVAVAGEKEIAVAIARHYKGESGPDAGPGFARDGRDGLELEEPMSNLPSSLTGFTPPRGTPYVPAPVASASQGEEIARLRQELDKSTKVLRGLIDLLVQKQLMSADELRASIARLVGG